MVFRRLHQDILPLLLSLLIALASLTLAFDAGANGVLAPGGPGKLGTWARPDKDAFGTTLSRPVWFTVAEGVLTEVHYPLIDRLQTRDTRLLIRTNNKVYDERRDFEHEVTRLPGTLAYKVVSQSQLAKVEKTIIASVDHDAITLEYDIAFRRRGPYELILVHNPASESTPGGDVISVVRGVTGEPVLVASQIDLRGDEPETLKKVSTQSLNWTLEPSRATVGFEGVNSPEDQLANGSWMQRYDRAEYGNVAGALVYESSQLRLHFTVTLSFSKSAKVGFFSEESRAQLERQQQEWAGYLSRLNFNRADALSEASILVVKGLEDKTYRGALIAAPAVPSIPWHVEAPESPYEDARRRVGDSNAGYNRVWPRDLFHKALALLAVGDVETPVNILDFYRRNQKSEGWWAQNMFVDGTQSWGAMQLDQVGFPILLVARLVSEGLVSYADFSDMTNRAAHYILKVGPWTDQERWEEMGGLSPNTLAVAVDALRAASWLESKVGRLQTSERYGSKAREWTLRLKDWALIKNGKFGGGYFARMERGSDNRQWNPSLHELIGIANKGPGQQVYYGEDQILDGGFLQWILAGLVPAHDSDFTKTINLYDQVVRKQTSAGWGYLRYNEDAYGEFHRGGAWPLLSAERAIVGIERGENWQEHLSYVKNCKTKGDMLGEQDTLAVRPLGWSHAAWLILEKSASLGRSYYKGPYTEK